MAVAAVLAIAATAAHAQLGLEVSLSAAGVVSRTTTSATGNISDTPTKSVAVLGGVRYHLAKHHALELDFGHTNNSQIFSVPPDTYRVTTGIGEFTAAYVFTPYPEKRLQPYLLAGGGVLSFRVGNTYIDSIQQNLGANSRAVLAVVYGGGADYRVWNRLSLRLQYRGLIYRNPDFGVPSLFFTGARGHMAEPSAGLVMKF